MLIFHKVKTKPFIILAVLRRSV